MKETAPKENMIEEKDQKYSTIYVCYRLVVELAVMIILDVGALLWLFDFVKSAYFFSYALLFLVILAFVFLILSYFFLVRAVAIFKGRSKWTKGLKVFSVASFVFFIFHIIEIFFLVNGQLSCQSMYAHAFYRFSNTFFERKHDIALEAISEAIGCDKDQNPEYYIERADIYIKIYEDLYDESSSEIAHSIKSQYNINAMECLTNAVADCSVALLREPEKAEYHYKRGCILRKRGSSYAEDARIDLSKALKMEPENANYLLEYGKSLIEMEDCLSQNTGLDLIKKAAKNNIGQSGNKEYYIYILKALQGIDNCDKRANDYENYLRNNDSYTVLGDYMSINAGVKKTSKLVNFLKNHVDFANEIITCLGEYVDERTVDIDVVYDYSTVLRSSEQYDKALEYINRVIEKEPSYLKAYKQRGIIYNKLHNYNKAILDADILLSVADYASNREFRADLLYNNKQYKEAIEDYKVAASKNYNGKAYCHYSIGQSYYRIKEYENAVVFFEKAIEEGLEHDELATCYREWADSCYTVGSGMIENGDTEGALKLFNKAAYNYHNAIKTEEKDSNLAHCYYWAGMAHVWAKDYVKAVEDFEKACKLDENKAEYESALEKYRKHV